MRNINTPLDFGRSETRSLSLLTQIKVLCGGALFQVGAVFFWFGLPFSLVFVLESEVRNVFKFDGAWVESVGMLQETEETNASVNDRPIYRYYFSYNVEGQSYQGYSSSVQEPSYVETEAGRELSIQYKEGNVARSRIVGMRQETFSFWIAFVLIFPLIGGIVYFSAIITNLRALSLLKRGRVAQGKYLRSTDTGSSVNEQPIYKYEFGFEVDGRSHIATAKTHLTASMEDEETEMILYDPKNPERNIVYDSIESINKLDLHGDVPKAGIRALLNPLSTILGLIATYFVFKFFL